MATQLACDLRSSRSLSWSELRVHSPPSHRRQRHLRVTLGPLNNLLPKAGSLWHCQPRTAAAWAKGLANPGYRHRTQRESLAAAASVFVDMGEKEKGGGGIRF